MSSKFQTLFFAYKLSYYACATCDRAREQITHFRCPVLVTSITKWVWSSVAVKHRLRHSLSSETRSVHCKSKISVLTRIHPPLRPFEHILSQSSPAYHQRPIPAHAWIHFSPRRDRGRAQLKSAQANWTVLALNKEVKLDPKNRTVFYFPETDPILVLNRSSWLTVYFCRIDADLGNRFLNRTTRLLKVLRSAF